MLQSLGFMTEVAVSARMLERCSAEDGGTPPTSPSSISLAGDGRAKCPPHPEIRSDVLVFVTRVRRRRCLRFQEYGFDGVLPKPFAVSDLRRALAVG
jgi:hypothetical protein